MYLKRSGAYLLVFLCFIVYITLNDENTTIKTTSQYCEMFKTLKVLFNP